MRSDRPATARHRIGVVLAVGLLALGAGACSKDDGPSVPSTTAGRPATTGTVGPDDATTSTRPAPSTTTPTASTTADPAAARLTFRPVLAVQPCATTNPGGDPLEGTTAPGATTSATAPPKAELLPTSDGSTCLRVGPIAATGADLGSATVSQMVDDSSQWAVDVRATDAGRGRLNDVFNACFDGAANCPPTAGTSDPHGAVAIVFDGRVLAYPAVNGADLADDEFTIFGELDERQAKELARVIEG